MDGPFLWLGYAALCLIGVLLLRDVFRSLLQRIRSRSPRRYAYVWWGTAISPVVVLALGTFAMTYEPLRTWLDGTHVLEFLFSPLIFSLILLVVGPPSCAVLLALFIALLQEHPWEMRFCRAARLS
ncbi:MAG: hypothetical protein QM775_36075 [Pirellulales bacterium]